MLFIQRGNNRESSFFDQQDYLFYLGCLGDACYRYHVWRRKKGEVVTGLYFQLAWRKRISKIKEVGDKTQSFSFVTDPFNYAGSIATTRRALTLQHLIVLCQALRLWCRSPG